MSKLQKFHRMTIAILAVICTVLIILNLHERREHDSVIYWMQERSVMDEREINLLQKEVRVSKDTIYNLQMELSETTDLYNKATWTIEVLNTELEGTK